MQEEGWFKFHRQMFKNPVCTKDSEYFFVWLWILNEACYEEKRAWFKSKDIVLQKGQILTTVKEISKDLNVSEKKVYRILNLLENEKQIEKQASNKNTLITVLNWEKYQSCEEQDEKPVRNEWETSEKRMGNLPIIKEYKNIRNKEYITDTNVSVRQTEAVRQALTEWNKLVDFGIPQVSRMSPDSKRYKNLNARINQYGIDEVLRAINNIRKSSFLQGRNKNGWSIKFDWFILPNNFPKVLEGNYTDREDANMDGLSAVDREFLERHKDDRY